jgi:hypothetical protein
MSGYAHAKEMEEKVGLTLDRRTDFIRLGTMIPSAGGSDERIVDYCAYCAACDSTKADS